MKIVIDGNVSISQTTNYENSEYNIDYPSNIKIKAKISIR